MKSVLGNTTNAFGEVQQIGSEYKHTHTRTRVLKYISNCAHFVVILPRYTAARVLDLGPLKVYLCRTVFLNVFAGWTRALCSAVYFPLLLSYPAWVALRPTTYFCCPRAVLISGMRLARNLRSRAKVIQKMGNWLSGQRLGEKNRKMQSSVKGKDEDLLSRQESRAARRAAPRF